MLKYYLETSLNNYLKLLPACLFQEERKGDIFFRDYDYLQKSQFMIFHFFAFFALMVSHCAPVSLSATPISKTVF